MKLSTKLIIGLFVFLVLVIGFYIFSLRQVDYDLVIVDDQEKIPDKSCNELKDDVLIIMKTGCLACAKAEPILKKIEKEENLEFKYYNLAIKEQREELMRFGFIPQYVPSVIINCKVYSGAYSKERYLELFGK